MRHTDRGPMAPLAVLIVVLAVLVTACGGSAVPMASPATAAPPVDATPAVDPTPALTPVLTPVAGGGQGEATVVAQNIAFEPGKIGVPANVPITLVMENRDEGIPHGVAISDAAGNQVFQGEIITGPARQALALAPLAPGEYPFMCPVHPNMTGVIIAQP